MDFDSSAITLVTALPFASNKNLSKLHNLSQPQSACLQRVKNKPIWDWPKVVKEKNLRSVGYVQPPENWSRWFLCQGDNYSERQETTKEEKVFE